MTRSTNCTCFSRSAIPFVNVAIFQFPDFSSIFCQTSDQKLSIFPANHFYFLRLGLHFFCHRVPEDSTRLNALFVLRPSILGLFGNLFQTLPRETKILDKTNILHLRLICSPENWRRYCENGTSKDGEPQRSWGKDLADPYERWSW